MQRAYVQYLPICLLCLVPFEPPPSAEPEVGYLYNLYLQRQTFRFGQGFRGF